MTETNYRERLGGLGAVRLSIGLLQGLAAWRLIEAGKGVWSAHNPGVFAGLVLITAFPPLILLAGVGHLRWRTLWSWTLAAAALLFGLALYDIWRDPMEGFGAFQHKRWWPSAELIGFGGVALYIAHHLIEPADVERRWWPSYSARFESAWRHGFQLVLALLFTGIFWGVLQLGAALFDVIGVKLIGETIRKTWFNSPATAMAFAGAVHLTDVRPNLIRGVRTVGLTLLAWLTPLAVGLATAFLVTLPFTGLAKLWATHRSAPLLLGAVGWLIVLMNAAYQDGAERTALPAILRWSVRIGGVVLLPLTLLAAWATVLRIEQYGLTPERIVSIATLIGAAAYSIGYGWAALSPGPWMRRLEVVNVAAAVVILTLILAFLSPVADPARLATDDQVARLQSHLVPTDRFDFAFFRFRAARFGREALNRLASSRDAEIAARATRARSLTDAFYWRAGAEPEAREAPLSHAKIWPVGAILPDTFRRQDWSGAGASSPSCLTGGEACDIFLLNIAGGKESKVLVESGAQFDVYQPDMNGKWASIGSYNPGPYCKAATEALRSGQFHTSEPALPDLDIGAQHLSFHGHVNCVETQPAKPSPPPGPPGGLGPAFRQ